MKNYNKKQYLNIFKIHKTKPVQNRHIQNNIGVMAH